MNWETIGSAALGGLIMTTLFLGAFVIVGLRLFSWGKSVLFRFGDFQARQTEDGVTLQGGFKRLHFVAPERIRAREITAGDRDTPHEPILPGGKTIKGKAGEDLPPRTRLALDDNGHLRIARAEETAVGYVIAFAPKGSDVLVTVPDERSDWW